MTLDDRSLVFLTASRDVDSVAALPGSPWLLFACGEDLLAVDAAPVLARPAEVPPLDPEKDPRVKPVWTGFDGPAPVPTDRELVRLRAGRVELFAPGEPQPLRSAEISGAEGRLLPLAAGGPDRLLVLEMDLKDRELIVYRGGLIDTVGGRVTRRGLFRAPAPQVTAAWSPSAGGFLVIDEVAGGLLRIAPDADKPEVALSPEPHQPRPSALAVHPALPLVAVHLSDAMEGTSHLLTAEPEGNALRRPMRAIMPEGVIRSLAWRPDGPLLAVLRQNGRKSYLTVMDRHGAIFADARLPDGWSGTSAAWSPDGSAVLTASANTLAVLRFG